MPGVTPNQGFPFATMDDPPCSLPSTMGALGAVVDGKSSGLDADSARVGANNFVQISLTNTTTTTSTSTPPFTTVDVNRGTPTDLSIFTGLILGPGIWMVGLLAQIARWNPPSIAYPVTISLQVAGESDTTDGLMIDCATPGYLLAGNAAFAGNLLLSVPQQNVSVSAITSVASTTRINYGILAGTQDPVSYAAMWAFQIGDL